MNRTEQRAETKTTHIGEVQVSLRLWPHGMCGGFTGFINNCQRHANTKGAAVPRRSTLSKPPLHLKSYYQHLTGAGSPSAHPPKASFTRKIWRLFLYKRSYDPKNTNFFNTLVWHFLSITFTVDKLCFSLQASINFLGCF